MNFEIRGQTQPGPLPRQVRDILAHVEKLKDGILLTSAVLMQELGRTSGRMVFGCHPALFDFREKHPRLNLVYWGNKKTIEAFRKQFAVKRELHAAHHP